MQKHRSGPPRVSARNTRKRPSRPVRAERDAFSLHVRWNGGPRTHAWSELWNWLLAEADEADDGRGRDEVA